MPTTKLKSKNRNANLKRMLNARLLELQNEMRSGLRDGHGGRPQEDGADGLEHSEADIQRDIKYALLKMRAETLSRINAALGRIDAGSYGVCAECEGDISEARLSALPFAVRCHECEGQLEQTQRQSDKMARSRGGFSLFPDPTRP